MNNFFQKLTTKQIFFIYAVVIVLYYHQIFFTYFQSDEWHFFQVFLPYTHTWSGVLRSGIDIVRHPERFSIPHATPLSIIFWTASMKLFGLHVTPHFILSLTIHMLNSILLYTFSKRLSGNKLLSFLAGLFFAISANQFQSVVWIGTYLITSTAVTFTLLALIALYDHLEKHTNVWPYIMWTIFALLTKESTLLLIPVSLLLVVLKYNTQFSRFQWRFVAQLPAIRCISILTLMYAPSRIIIARIFTSHLTKSPTLDASDPAFGPLLVLFRLVTYPIKILVELFIPYPVVPPIVEFLTPLAYQYYGAEKSVRGTTFLLFTQSAGIDLLIYSLAGIFITLLVMRLFYKKDQLKHVLIFSLIYIIFASWPLIMIASFAPAAAYVSFFDSRHMYLPAVGGGLLFGYVIVLLYHTLQSKFTGSIARGFIILCMLLWSGGQYFALQYLITPYAESGRDRRELTSIIMQEVTKKRKSGIVYIKSDSAYYGYGELMPPFETNFGQVLTVYFNQAGLLPDNFLDTSYLLSKGLNGQGAKKQQNLNFGYFINTNKLITALERKHTSIDDVYTFEWSGKEHRARVITDEFKNQLKYTMKDRSRYADWVQKDIPDLQFHLKIPPHAQLLPLPSDNPQVQHAYRLTTSTSSYDVRFMKRIFNVGIFEDVSLMSNADGELIGEDYYYRTINMKDSTSTIAKIPNKGNHLIYFLPALMPQTILKIDIPQAKPMDKEHGDMELEEIISLMSTGEE